MSERLLAARTKRSPQKLLYTSPLSQARLPLLSAAYCVFSMTCQPLNIDANLVINYLPHTQACLALIRESSSAGHWLGLDTHDTAAVGYDRPLRPGVAMTVEPGLYLPPDNVRFGKYAGIGIRIEDDVLVSEDGPEVLTADVPADAREVERLVGLAHL